MSELAERSGVSAGTIKHYLREGLLGSEDDVLRTSRNMAYYPEEFVERIRLIKRLQEERFMPLRVIREVVAEDPERAARRDRARGPDPRAGDRGAASRPGVARRGCASTYDLPGNVLDRLEELGVLTPDTPRLRRRRRGHHRGHLPLSRRRIRGGDRLHRLRHAALPRGAGAAGRGGGAGPARPPGRRGRCRAGGRRSSPPAPSRCAS